MTNVMDKALSFGPMEDSTLENGKMKSSMVLEPILAKTVNKKWENGQKVIKFGG